MKKDGDAVEMDEAIAELESDKATFELTAEKAGVLKTIAKEGDVLPIGAVVCTIEGAGAAASTARLPGCSKRYRRITARWAAAQPEALLMRRAHHRLLQLKYWPKKVLTLKA
jgi:pyruvate/2-oxoglutarate dehydrogenase complex dihydrolipoamide acyltransferase (E2) component